ncbi:MAG TPA: hypothetical protein VNB90_03265 [Cytophagaceae bacterium]|jgi:hypothetical protein|nr:hypothetical protein [Cytophagaceae bacterium]
MKSKTTTYILMSGVLLIWGLVFYRVFAGLDSNNDDVVVMAQKLPAKSIEQKEEPTVLVLGNYRDPFLGAASNAFNVNENVIAKKTVSSKTKLTIKKEEATAPIDWSFINYIGIVYNKQTDKKVGVIRLWDKEYMVSEKDIINNVTILHKEKDSMQVEYNGNKQWIRR